MSDDIDGIQAAIRSLRKVHEDIALLLRTAEEQMGSQGWRPSEPSCMRDTSSNLKTPWKWMPTHVFLFMTNPECRGVLAFVTVILDDPNHLDHVEQPLVSAGWLERPDGKLEGKAEYAYCHCHLRMPGRTDDGRVVTASADELRDVGQFTRATTLAVPLMSLHNVDDLNSRVVKPLMTILPNGSTHDS